MAQVVSNLPDVQNQNSQTRQGRKSQLTVVALSGSLSGYAMPPARQCCMTSCASKDIEGQHMTKRRVVWHGEATKESAASCKRCAGEKTMGEP